MIISKYITNMLNICECKNEMTNIYISREDKIYYFFIDYKLHLFYKKKLKIWTLITHNNVIYRLLTGDLIGTRFPSSPT